MPGFVQDPPHLTEMELNRCVLVGVIFTLIVVAVSLAPIITGVPMKVLVPILAGLVALVLLCLGFTVEGRRKVGFFLRVLPWTRNAGYHDQ